MLRIAPALIAALIAGPALAEQMTMTRAIQVMGRPRRTTPSL